jgi:hypothetical protein
LNNQFVTRVTRAVKRKTFSFEKGY